MELDVRYTGESVRHAICRLYGEHTDALVTIPHVSVPPITAALVKEHAAVFDTILRIIQDELRSEQREQQQNATGSASRPAVVDHWLLSVPSALWRSEMDVVNYLGMLVAIDFCHWAQVLPPGGQEKVEEGGIVAAPGDEVIGFAGFYTVVEEKIRSPLQPAASSDKHSLAAVPCGDADTTELFAEPKDTAPSPSSGESATAAAKDVTLLRGSAAMMWLLRRAAEEHHVAWYDIDYLQQFHGDVDAALSALRVCFMGCEKDGVTPLWMPCTRTRVQLLLSLSDAFAAQHTSYYELLKESGGYVFCPPENTAAARAGVRGFVPSLVRFHPRYCDFARACGSDSVFLDSDSDANAKRAESYVPILKLSQLTSLALEQALPALWRSGCCAKCVPSSAQPAQQPASSWLAERAMAVVSTGATGLFTDRAELSICCDYQIPKALRAAGLLVYDTSLAHMVDRHVLLRPGSVEEASIRIATLVAADRLLRYVNAQLEQPLLAVRDEDVLRSTCTSFECSVNHLDYALWYIGRYMVPTEARHHLCRTIMY
ncbi:putative Queuosine Q salvage protein family [Lotmaria passim]